MRVPILLILGLFAVVFMATAQGFTSISYSVKDSLYVQNFDGLPNTGSFSLTGKGPHSLANSPINASNISGWQIFAHGGSSTNAAFAVSTGSATTQGVYSLGTSGSTDRALGTLASGTGIYSLGISFTNNTGSTLNQISIAFTAEQWRKGGSTNKNTWKCFYKTGSLTDINEPNKIELTALHFSSLQTTSGSATLQGNLAENKQVITATISGIEWKASEQLILVWEDADETGSDDIVAIDDFSFRASFVQTNTNSVQEIVPLAINPTNADTIQYQISLSGNTSGLTKSNFNLVTNGITNASITKIEGSGKNYTASVYTGTGAGYISLGIANNANLIPGLSNTPFYSIDTQWIDKIKPVQINFTHSADTLLQLNDTLQLFLHFNEPVYLDTTNGFSYLPVTIGSRVKNIPFVNGNGTNTLKFNYIIQQGEIDKDGIRIASAFNARSLSVKDEAGNSASLTINSTPIQKIKVDAITPVFTQASDTTISFCSGSSNVSINTFLKINNTEANELVQWKLIQAPRNYVLTKQLFDSSASTATLEPNGFSISNPNNSNSTDTCIFSISDGINIAYKKIIFSILINQQWTGAYSSQWTNPLNWCNNNVPADSASVVVPRNAINMPIINTNATVHQIQLEQSASLTITGTLKITGNIIGIDTAVDASNATIIMEGNTQQIIDGKIFKQETIQKLVIANSGAISISNPIKLTHSLTLQKGVLNTNNKLVFTKQALLTPVANGASIQGKFIVETDWLEKDTGLYMIGNPFENTMYPSDFDSVMQLQKMIPVQHTINTSSFDYLNKYAAAYSHITGSNQHQKNTITGYPNIGTQQITLWKTDSSGFAFLSNPYLSPIQTQYFQPNQSLAKYYWVWNPKQGKTGGFTCIAADQPYTINIGEAIALYAFSPSNTNITISEEAKTTGRNTNDIAMLEKLNDYIISLDLLENAKFQDRLTLIHLDNGKNNFDSLDAPKLLNPGYNIYSKTNDGKPLAVDIRKLDNNSSIPIQLHNMIAGNYQFKVSKAVLPSTNNLVLHDRYLNTYLSLQKDSIYQFSITTDSGSISENRFEIAANIPLAPTERLTHSLVVKLYPNPVIQDLNISVSTNTNEPIQIRITNTSGMVLKTLAPIFTRKALMKIPVGDLPNGLYILQISSGDTNQSLQFFKQ